MPQLSDDEKLKTAGNLGYHNILADINFAKPRMIISVFGTNLHNEKYLISAGNTGRLFGVPTFVPDAPRMADMKLTWMFSSKNKRVRKYVGEPLS